MNTAVTSKEAILKVCRQITASDGLPGLNMRTVANRCHIALGTLYNYFPDYVAFLFDRVRQGTGKYPDFLSAHSISIAGTRRGEARSIMDHYFDHMKQGLLEVLHADANVSRSAFSPSLTETAFVKFVLDHMLLLLVQKETDCSAFIEILRRVLYY